MPSRTSRAGDERVDTHSRPHIILAEDDEAMRRLLARALARANYTVTACEDGGALLRTLELVRTGELEAELIVTDVRMPVASGLDVLEQLSSAPIAASVILISAFCDPQTLLRAKELGAACVLSKPFDMDILRNAVACALMQRGVAPYVAPEE